MTCISNILLIFVLTIINCNAKSENTYLEHSPVGDAPFLADSSAIGIGDSPSSIGLFTFMKLKLCHKCGNYKPKKEFYKCISKKDGLQTKCIDCCRKIKMKYSSTVHHQYVTCLKCKKSYLNLRGLCSHLYQVHNMNPEEYYDKYIKDENEGICVCGKKTKFKKLRLGYFKYCSTKCSNSNEDVKNKRTQTCLIRHGVDHSSKIPSVRKKMRLNLSKRISGNDAYSKCMYNPKACKIIDDFGKENGYDFQHAENGGEYLVYGLGYFLDGYDNNKNVAIEFYEAHHKYRKKKDEKRRRSIMNLLKCEFIIIYHDGKISKYVYKK